MDKVKKRIGYRPAKGKGSSWDGTGISAAILDTGIAAHPDFRGRIVSFVDYVNGEKLLYDDSGHGTHVAGILAGDGRMSGGILAGMAPGARLCILKVLDQNGEGKVDHIIKGVRWIEENAGRFGIRVVNISVGAKAGLDVQKEEMLLEAVERLWDMGFVVVVSAGNYGPGERTIAVPGTSRKVITVGALQEEGKSGCSGNGPTGECVVKPDLVAPGYQIISCSNLSSKTRKPYTVKSGSSMATPVVSGAIAVLLSRYPDMSNVEVKLRLRETCERIPDRPSGTGWGMLQADRLISAR